MDDRTVPFHAAKPGLLTLGEVVDGAVQLLEQVVPGQPSLEVPRHIAVFQAVILQPIPGDAFGMEPRHLLDEPSAQSLP
jgi:hypothetical protein